MRSVALLLLVWFASACEAGSAGAIERDSETSTATTTDAIPPATSTGLRPTDDTASTSSGPGDGGTTDDDPVASTTGDRVTGDESGQRPDTTTGETDETTGSADSAGRGNDAGETSDGADDDDDDASVECRPACPPGSACIDGQCTCVPDCVGRECGPNGCGGSCGSCGAYPCEQGQCGSCLPTPPEVLCDDTFTASEPCGTLWDDGCGNSVDCGGCPTGEVCWFLYCCEPSILDCGDEGRYCAGADNGCGQDLGCGPCLYGTCGALGECSCHLWPLFDFECPASHPHFVTCDIGEDASAGAVVAGGGECIPGLLDDEYCCAD